MAVRATSSTGNGKSTCLGRIVMRAPFPAHQAPCSLEPRRLSTGNLLIALSRSEECDAIPLRDRESKGQAIGYGC